MRSATAVRRLTGAVAAWVTIAALTGSASCVPSQLPPPPTPEDSTDARTELSRATTSYWREMIPRRPRMASAIGQRVEFLPAPFTRSGDNDRTQFVTRRLGRALDEINVTALSPRDYASLQTLRWELEMEGEGATFDPIDFSALSPGESSIRDAIAILQEHPFTTSGDLDRYLFLLDGLALWFTDMRGVLEERRVAGVLPSRDAVDSFRAWLTKFREIVGDSGLRVTSERVRSIDTALVAPFREQEVEGTFVRVVPALDSLIGFLSTYRSAALERPGLWQYPGGKEYYRHLLRRRLALEVEPEEAHQAALSQLRRVDSLLATLMRRINPRGPLKLDSLRALPQVAPISADSVATLLRQHMRAARDTLRSRFSMLPDSEPSVRVATPLEALLAPEGKVIPPEFAGYLGTIVVTPALGSTTMRLLGPARLFAWSWPGRALASTLSYAPGVLNPVVVLHAARATEAGWAEYAATIAGELGYLNDPLAAWGQLMHEALSAAWLAVDTGIHYYGWSRAQALTLLRPFSTATNAELDSMFVARVVQSPGSAGAAAIGAREFAAMRTWMDRIRGLWVNPVAWHREVLEAGPVPLPVLAAHLEWWSAKK